MQSTDPRMWVFHAENDYRAMCASVAAIDPPWTSIVMLAQQSCEKYLKALVLVTGKSPDRTHDLADLLKELASSYPQLQQHMQDLAFLSTLWLPSRYPLLPKPIDEPRGKHAVEITERFRQDARNLLQPYL